MPNLILIRHSLPEMIHTMPANQWHLSEEGRLRCKTLAEKIKPYLPDVIITSPEPKALETAQILSEILGKEIKVIEDLREHERSNVGWMEKEVFERKVSDFFRSSDVLVFGTETADQAHKRFANAISGLIDEFSERNIAIISHGTVISLWIARRTGSGPI